MAMGPGKYDVQCTKVRLETHARGVVLLVIEGDKGSGMSAQLPPDLLLTLPAMLRQWADDIELKGPVM